MEKALSEHAWVVGDQFTLADACLAPYFQTLLQFDWTALYDRNCPNVAHWFECIQQRSSFQAAVADDFPEALIAELREKGRAAWEKIEAHLD